MPNKFYNMDKDFVCNILNQDSKFDAGWVDNAAEILISDPMYEVEKLSKFTAEQLGTMKKALTDYKADQEFINLIYNPELNVTQMQIAIAAKNNGVKNEWISALTNPKLHYTKANYIAQGMADGFNLCEIINVYEFDPDQVYEIFAGIKLGIDYKAYAKKKYPAEIMGVVRHAMQLNLKVSIADTDPVYITIYQ